MKQELLIAVDEWQTRVAVIEDGRLTELHFEPRHLDGLVGNLYVGRINRILPGMESAFVDIGLDRDGFLFEGDMGPPVLEAGLEKRSGKNRGLSIKDLKEGQRILVQVAKEPMGPKGARLSTQIALPGAYLIYMPNLDHVGVSRKIAGKERVRLKELIKRYKRDSLGGFIVRTAAEGVAGEELTSEMQGLADLWSLIRIKSARCAPPELVHQEADLIGRIIREILLKGDGSVMTEDETVYARCRELLSGLGLDAGRVRLWKPGGVSLFEHFHVQEEIEKALRPKVWLSSGGCIVIQSTEALVAIDVNSGRFTGKKSLEETAYAINMEAVEEIVRQIRLRSLGGIIVIDFIDMGQKSHREAVVNKLNEALERDRAKSRILNISEFGLVEMTRKRSHRNLERIMTGVCPCCDGRGRIPAPWRIAQQIAYAADGMNPPRQGVVTVSPDVFRYIEENSDRFAFAQSMRLERLNLVQPTHFSMSPPSNKD
jgi:ribonuclease G